MATERFELLADTVARPHQSGKGWLMMNRQEGGYSEFAYYFDTLKALVDCYAVQPGRLCIDEHGVYVPMRREKGAGNESSN